MSRPRLLDLFCGGGGAARGYQLAGFHVTGVDIAPQPRYAGDEFHQADALTFLAEERVDFTAVHASPPCQAFTAYRRRGDGVGDGYPDLVAATRERFEFIGKPWIIENVVGAPLRNPTTLCGSMFDLEVRRHRLFESNLLLMQPECRHDEQAGEFPPATNRKNARHTCEIGVWRIPLEQQKRAMGVDWDCTLPELSQMVPPAFSAFLGAQLLSFFPVKANE